MLLRNISHPSILYANAPRNGFFGLTELHAYTHFKIAPYFNSGAASNVVLDFSNVRIWDISALLWLTVALDHYKRHFPISWRLRLPQSNEGMSDEEQDIFDYSADYLRQWRFDVALRNISADFKELLVPEQQAYFDPPGPRRYFLPSDSQDAFDLTQSLMSGGFAEIRNLADAADASIRAITSMRINKCIDAFQAGAIGEILFTHCDIDKPVTELLSEHLIELVLNVQEHSNASIGMIATSYTGFTNELIVCAVNNGSSICETIYPNYLRKTFASRFEKDKKYDDNAMTVDERAEIVDYSTQIKHADETDIKISTRGIGLASIKENCVIQLSGKLAIISDAVRLTYWDSSGDVPMVEEWPYQWRGSLLRVSIPLKLRATRTPLLRGP